MPDAEAAAFDRFLATLDYPFLREADNDAYRRFLTRDRSARHFVLGHHLGQHIRDAGRGLVKRPGFTAVAVLSLALGIGANAALFSLVDTLLLRSLPVHAPDRLVFVQRAAASGKKVGIDRPAYDALLSLRDTYEDVAEYTTLARPTVIIDGAVEPERLVAQATGNFFRTLGVDLAAGRDEAPEPPAVISHRLWQTRFGGDRAVVGRTITVNSASYVITGVAASGFGGVLARCVGGHLAAAAGADVRATLGDRAASAGRDDGAGAGRH